MTGPHTNGNSFNFSSLINMPFITYQKFHLRNLSWGKVLKITEMVKPQCPIAAHVKWLINVCPLVWCPHKGGCAADCVLHGVGCGTVHVEKKILQINLRVHVMTMRMSCWWWPAMLKFYWKANLSNFMFIVANIYVDYCQFGSHRYFESNIKVVF